MKMRHGLGLVSVGTASDGSNLYIAEEGDDMSSFFAVSTTPDGTVIYGDNPNVTPPSSTLDNIAKIVGAVGGFYQQKTVTDINATRIRQGLPPLTQAQTGALTPGVNVGLSPATQQLVMYGGLALLAIFLFKTMRS